MRPVNSALKGTLIILRQPITRQICLLPPNCRLKTKSENLLLTFVPPCHPSVLLLTPTSPTEHLSLTLSFFQVFSFSSYIFLHSSSYLASTDYNGTLVNYLYPPYITLSQSVVFLTHPVLCSLHFIAFKTFAIAVNKFVWLITFTQKTLCCALLINLTFLEI